MKFKKLTALIIIMMLILLSTTVVVLFYTEKDSIYFVLGSGVLASIFASLIFSALNIFILKEPISERDELKDLISEFKARQLNGVMKISPKFEQKPEYWNGLIANSDSQLDMLGHAFTTWTHKPHSTSFSEKIIKIAKSGGLVRIVILDPEGKNTANLESRFGKKYSERIKGTLSFFDSDIYAKLSDAKKKNVIIKLESDSEVSFMYINNGSQVVVSPYYTKHSDSKDNLVIELDSKSKFSDSYSADFEEVFKSASERQI